MRATGDDNGIALSAFTACSDVTVTFPCLRPARLAGVFLLLRRMRFFMVRVDGEELGAAVLLGFVVLQKRERAGHGRLPSGYRGANAPVKAREYMVY